MAFTCGFFNSENGDRKYNAEQMSAIFDGIIADGVFTTIGDHMAVTAGTGMQVLVGTGKAWFDHTWNVNDAAYPLAIAASDVTLSRIDAIVLETNHSDSVRLNKLRVVQGTVASSPVKPTLTNSENVHQHPLAWVTVAPGVTQIAASAIENAVGTSACPFVTGIIATTSIDDLFNQWNGEFDEWFDNIKAQLSDNVVANLQRQIDANKIQNDTKEAYGLPKDASNDDAFKDILDRFSQNEREVDFECYDVSLADELGMNITQFIRDNQSNITRVSTACPMIIKNDSRITILPTSDGRIYYYKLKSESICHRVDLSDISSKLNIPNISSVNSVLFDYDGIYFCIVSAVNVGDNYTLYLFKTKDFTSYETVSTYLANKSSIGINNEIATSDNKRYMLVSVYESSNQYKYLCELSANSLTLKKLPYTNKSFGQTSFYEGYFYEATFNRNPNRIRIIKTHFITGEAQYIDIPSDKNLYGTTFMVIKCKNKIYLFSVKTYNEIDFNIGKSWVSCLVSSDGGNTFIIKDLTNLLDSINSSATFDIRYNSVSDRLLLIERNILNQKMYELNNDEFEYVRSVKTHFYSSLDGLDANTFLGIIYKRIDYTRSNGSRDYADRHHPSVFKLHGKIKVIGQKHGGIRAEIAENNTYYFIRFSGILRSFYDTWQNKFIYPDLSNRYSSPVKDKGSYPIFFVNSILYMGEYELPTTRTYKNIGIIEIP